MSAWPNIPGPLFGPMISSTPSVVRTQMDGGRPRQRQRFTQALWTYNTTVALTKDADLTTFLNWWSATIHQGADWFTLSLKGPSGAFTGTARIVGGAFEHRQIDGGWQITMNIELDRPLPQ